MKVLRRLGPPRVSTPKEWGWTSYERTNWEREDGRRLYIGHFKQNNDPFNWTEVRIKFWARRPIVALGTICRSGKDPVEFEGQAVN